MEKEIGISDLKPGVCKISLFSGQEDPTYSANPTLKYEDKDNGPCVLQKQKMSLQIP